MLRVRRSAGAYARSGKIKRNMTAISFGCQGLKDDVQTSMTVADDLSQRPRKTRVGTRLRTLVIVNEQVNNLVLDTNRAICCRHWLRTDTVGRVADFSWPPMYALVSLKQVAVQWKCKNCCEIVI